MVSLMTRERELDKANASGLTDQHILASGLMMSDMERVSSRLVRAPYTMECLKMTSDKVLEK